MTTVRRAPRSALRPAGIAVAVQSRVEQHLVSAANAKEVVRRALTSAGVRRALISVTFVSRGQIARLNAAHLDKPGSTDVITFAFAPVTPRAPLVADVYIAPDVVRANARAFGVSAREELLRVLVHGSLHAAGLEHPETGDRTRSPMWRRQERLVRQTRRRSGPAANR